MTSETRTETGPGPESRPVPRAPRRAGHVRAHHEPRRAGHAPAGHTPAGQAPAGRAPAERALTGPPVPPPAEAPRPTPELISRPTPGQVPRPTAGHPRTAAAVPAPSEPAPPRPRRALQLTWVLGVGVLVAGGLNLVLDAGSPGQTSPTAQTVAGTVGGTTGAATGLDADLEARFARAVAGAAQDGVELTLTSGWRSAEEQEGLVRSTLERYGSVEEARRWVLPPETSAHVAGLAVDVGPTVGALWLEEHGSDYGLCRTYANELWHFEPVVDPGGTCPTMHEDSSAGWVGYE